MATRLEKTVLVTLSALVWAGALATRSRMVPPSPEYFFLASREMLLVPLAAQALIGVAWQRRPIGAFLAAIARSLWARRPVPERQATIAIVAPLVLAVVAIWLDLSKSTSTLSNPVACLVALLWLVAAGACVVRAF